MDESTIDIDKNLIYSDNEFDKKVVEISKHGGAIFKENKPSNEILNKLDLPDSPNNVARKNKKRLYNMYQLDWMLQKEYDIERLIDSIDCYVFDKKYGKSTHIGYNHEILRMYDDWLNEDGFKELNISRNIWLSFEEFIKTKFLQINYIVPLILRLHDVEKRTLLLEWYKNYQREHKELN